MSYLNDLPISELTQELRLIRSDTDNDDFRLCLSAAHSFFKISQVTIRS